MEILRQTNQRLIIGTPASALVVVRLIGIALSFPGLLVLAIYLLGGAADYSSLNCQRSRPTERQCRFLRLSPVRPFFYRFPIDAIQSVTLQARQLSLQPRAGGTGYRLQLQLPQRRFPLSVGYSNQRQRQITLQANVQDFIDDPTAPSLILRDWPGLGGLVLAVIFLLPTLPLSLLVIGLGATPVIVSFDKANRQITVSHKGIWRQDHKQCSFQDLDRIVVERIWLGGPSRRSASTERYALRMVLKSGESLLRYDYFQQQPADDIAQTMRQFLLDQPPSPEKPIKD